MENKMVKSEVFRFNFTNFAIKKNIYSKVYGYKLTILLNQNIPSNLKKNVYVYTFVLI